MLANAKIAAAATVKKALVAVNVDPGMVRAVIKKPPVIHGGPKVRHWPWPKRKHFDKRERDAVMKLMNREISRGGAIIYNGPEKAAYCKQFNEFMGGGFCETVNSGTNALYVALRALDPEPGSEIIVPPITDPGGSMPIALMNCIPIPADAEPGSLNTSAVEIAKLITDRTSAIVVAHISGHPLDMDPILELAARHNIPVVEDCAQAHGAIYKGRMVGTLGDISAFSTMFGKHHATGAQGGIVFTRDTMLFARVRQITDRGKPFGAVSPQGNPVASLNFNQDEISLAIGRVQLAKLPEFLKIRRAFAEAVAKGVANIPGVTLVAPPEGGEGAYWFLLFQLDFDKLDCTSKMFSDGLENEGIEGVHNGYPFYPTDHSWYRDAVIYGASGLPWSLTQEKPKHFELPNAHANNGRAIRVDVHEKLGPKDAADLVAVFRKLARHFAKISA